MSNKELDYPTSEPRLNTMTKSRLKSKPRSDNSALGRENLPFNDSSEKPCILICAHCMEKFQTKSQLKDHYRRFHKEFMDHNSSSQKRLVRKINRHMCGICSKHFADSWTLKHHQKTVHQAAREHKCPNCAKSFLSNKDMVRHFKGVHLGQKIVFPGEKRKLLKTSENLVEVNSFGCTNAVNIGDDIQVYTSEEAASEKKMVPNILKSSKSEKKNSSSCALVNKSNFVYGLVNKVVGIEKSAELIMETMDYADNDTVIEEDEYVSAEDIIVEIKNDEVKNAIDQPMFHQADDQPIFQLENLENLQFVLPEGSGEPQIIIPESGIRLTIPCGSEPGTNSGESEKQVLHLVPDQIEDFHVSQPESEVNKMPNIEMSPISSCIPVLENQSANSTDLPLKIFDQYGHLLANEKPSITPQEFKDGTNSAALIKSLEYPRKFVYKKVNGSASPHLVAVKELPRKINSSSVQQFKCDECNKYFITKDFLNKHVGLVHPELTTFINIFNGNLEGLGLNNDDQRLDNLDDIEDIIDVEHFNEEDLSNSSLLKSDCEDVLLSNPIKMPDVRIECKVCGVYFGNKVEFIKHKKIAHKRPQSFKCEECSSEFTSKQTLKSHMQSVHEGIKKVCSLCLKPVADLARHIRTQHKNEGKREFACDLCQISFRTNFSLQRHKETVHLKVKSWFCDLCEKSFGEKRDMERHKNAIHFGIKNKQSKWVCPECNIVFKLRREYDQHKSIFHANLTEEQVVKFLNSEMETKRQKTVNNFKL